jgi:hypothetical protein
MSFLYRIVAVVPGEHVGNDVMTTTGRKAVENTALRIGEILPADEGSFVLASSFPCAVETGEMVAKSLGCTTTHCREWLDDESSQYGGYVMREIEEMVTLERTLVLATNFLMLSAVMDAYSKKRLGKPFPVRQIRGANCTILCLQSGEVRCIP